MKMKTLFQLIPVTFIAGGLFLGCGGESHDHHDHDHDGDGKPDHGPGEHNENAAAGGDDYPLKTCLISDEPLGSHGDVVTLKHEGVTVKLCCEGCVEDFEKDPKKFLAKLEAAKKGELPKAAPETPEEGGEEKPEVEEGSDEKPETKEGGENEKPAETQE